MKLFICNLNDFFHQHQVLTGIIDTQHSLCRTRGYRVSH